MIPDKQEVERQALPRVIGTVGSTALVVGTIIGCAVVYHGEHHFHSLPALFAQRAEHNSMGTLPAIGTA